MSPSEQKGNRLDANNTCTNHCIQLLGDGQEIESRVVGTQPGPIALVPTGSGSAISLPCYT